MAGRMHERLAVRDDPDPEERVAGVMAAHGRALLAVANRWSICHDDALDAYQRALEIFLRRIDSVDPATEGAWLRVVVKHEALAIRRTRSGTVAGEDVDLDTVVAAPGRSIEELVAGGERVTRSAEALRALKPDEARALLLKAEGLSYHEIAERCQWSYTKVNRAITEGRRRFIQAYTAIESGEECDRFAPILASLAAGVASSSELVEVRPHLRHCVACRATVRELHISGLRRVKLLLPALLLAPLRRLRDQGGDPPIDPEELLRESAELQLPGTMPPGAADLGSNLPPGAADLLRHQAAPPPADPVTPHATDLGGQLTLDLPSRRLPLGHLRDRAAEILGRAQSSDVATGLQVLSTGGGGRIGALAATIGFCLSGIGAGALCVATGVLEAPGFLLPDHRAPAEPAHPHVKPKRAPADVRRSHLPATVRFAEAKATPVATATPTPRPRSRPKPSRPSPAADPSQGTTPTSHESAPISQVSSSSAPEFSLEPQSTQAPAYAPPTGGGEFTP